MNLNTKISRMSKLRKVDGQVGIEIECEVRDEFTQPWNSKFWALHRDGSLRGVGYEFVLAHPIHIRDIDTALKEWHTLCTAYNVRFVNSKRTSVHVHCNVQDYTILQVLNVICAYWLCEPLLLNICGEDRKGNLFCLGLDCADTVHTQLVQNLKKHYFFQGFAKDAFRYASLNLEALYKFGSLEFRTMRGTQDTKLIASWARELHYLVTNASKAKSPHDFLSIINEGKHKKFLRKLFTESFVTELIKATGHSWRDIINSRAMYVMDILHARDEWDPIKDEVNEKKIIETRKKESGTFRWPYEMADGQIYDISTFWANNGAHGFPIFQGREVGAVVQERYTSPDGHRYLANFRWTGLEWVPLAENDPRNMNIANNYLIDTTYHDIDGRLIEQYIIQNFGNPEPTPEIVGLHPRFRPFEPDLAQAAMAQPIDDIVPDQPPMDPVQWTNVFFDELRRARQREEEPERPVNNEPQV